MFEQASQPFLMAKATVVLAIQPEVRPRLQLIAFQLQGQATAAFAGACPDRVLQFRALSWRQRRMDVGAGPEQALSGLVVGGMWMVMVMQRLDVVAGIAEAEAMTPEHMGDAVVAARQAQRNGAGMTEAGIDRRIAADRPGVLTPVGIGMQGCGVPLLRLMAGQGEPMAGCGQAGGEVFQTLSEGDVSIGQQDDGIALLAADLQPVGVGSAAIEGYDFAGSSAGGQRWCRGFHPDEGRADRRMLEIVLEALIDFRLALAGGTGVILNAQNQLHRREDPVGDASP